MQRPGFVRTGAGIIVFDAPPSFAGKLPGVIEAHASGELVKFLLYSHSHADHVGGSTVFGGVEGLARFGGYVEFFDEILQYDFDTILTGHVSILGTREDVILNREYGHDVK
jgi:glyoxylase-like metal-dependent hydrolase (beta-lactamase superfamily II)